MKYFSKIHVYLSGTNLQIQQIDVIESEIHGLVKEVYLELNSKIKTLIESLGDILNEYYSSKHIEIPKFHSGKYIYYYRVDIYSVYDFNGAAWLYRTFTEKNYGGFETPLDLYQTLLYRINSELNKKKYSS